VTTKVTAVTTKVTAVTTKMTAVAMRTAMKTREVGGVGVRRSQRNGAGPGRGAVPVSEGAQSSAVIAEGEVSINSLVNSPRESGPGD